MKLECSRLFESRDDSKYKKISSDDISEVQIESNAYIKNAYYRFKQKVKHVPIFGPMAVKLYQKTKEDLKMHFVNKFEWNKISRFVIFVITK